MRLNFSRTFFSIYMEAYRSGHNGPDSKSGDGQPSVGSNPTASARNPLKMLSFQGIFYAQNLMYMVAKTEIVVKNYNDLLISVITAILSIRF